MFERFKPKNRKDRETRGLAFYFPVGKDPKKIAAHLEQVVKEQEPAALLPQAPVVEEIVFDSAEIVQSFMEEDSTAVFLGDDLIIDNNRLTKSDGAALNGVNNPVITRELSVNLDTGAMTESVVVVHPDTETPKGAITATLQSRWLRKPTEA